MAWTSQGATLLTGSVAFPLGTIGNVKSIAVSGITRSEIVRSGIESTHKQYLGGVVDYGTIECGINYTPALGLLKPDESHLGALTYHISMQTSSLFLQKWQFSAWIQAVTIEAAVDGSLEGSLTLRVTGPVTITTIANDMSGGGSAA